MPSRTSARATARRIRAPEATRDKLLAAAFAEIHRKGYQAASLDSILASAGVTKGALYHHFADKAELGQAVVAEIIVGLTLKRWTAPLEHHPGDPIEAIQSVIRNVSAEFSLPELADLVSLGCPLNNITQEMSPLDERFREQIAGAFALWTGAFAAAIERGRATHVVRADVDSKAVATFVVASIEGSFGLSKATKSAKLMHANMELLCQYLDGLRASPPRSAPPRGSASSRRAATKRSPAKARSSAAKQHPKRRTT